MDFAWLAPGLLLSTVWTFYLYLLVNAVYTGKEGGSLDRQYHVNCPCCKDLRHCKLIFFLTEHRLSDIKIK